MEDHLKGLKTGNQCRQSGEMQEPELMVNWVISTKKKKKCNTHKRFEKKRKIRCDSSGEERNEYYLPNMPKKEAGRISNLEPHVRPKTKFVIHAKK